MGSVGSRHFGVDMKSIEIGAARLHIVRFHRCGNTHTESWLAGELALEQRRRVYGAPAAS